MSSHRYSYFYYINGVKYIIKIDKSFSDISDLEDISRYSHEQRRAFAEHIIFKFGVSSPCILDASDFINPFATQVARLFNGHMTCIFIVGERETTLCLSGSPKNIFILTISGTGYTTVSMPCSKYRLLTLRVF